MDGSEQWWENHRIESLAKQLRILESLIELLETEIELQTPQTDDTPLEISGQSIFLVHGHDEGLIHEVARFLETLDIKVIVLREQPNDGRTIIEKFVDYSDVGFAVVLLTPDDKGGPINTPFEVYKPRARQNVVLELGYFLGKLGRRRVSALYREGVEIPSDYSGVLFVPLDSDGAWRLKLARELKAAGIEVDMNKAI
jgi:predicted nucleotide-binding protein